MTIAQCERFSVAQDVAINRFITSCKSVDSHSYTLMIFEDSKRHFLVEQNEYDTPYDCIQGEDTELVYSISYVPGSVEKIMEEMEPLYKNQIHQYCLCDYISDDEMIYETLKSHLRSSYGMVG